MRQTSLSIVSFTGLSCWTGRQIIGATANTLKEQDLINIIYPINFQTSKQLYKTLNEKFEILFQ